MKKNMGSADSIARVIIAAIIAILYFTGIINGTAATILLAAAVIFVITAFIGVCPLYLPFGINTRGKKKTA